MAPEAARRVKAVFPDAIIVILIRAQPEMIAAAYTQYVRGGGTHGPRRYLFPARYVLGAFRHAYKAPRFAFEHFEYDRLIAHYDALFGRDQVVVRCYEQLRSGHDAFIDDLCQATGLRLDRSAISHRKSNASFGLATMWLGRLLGLFTARSVMDKAYIVGIPGFYEIRRLLLKGFAAIDPTPSGLAALPGSIVRHIRERYAESNRRLVQSRALDLENFGYPVEEAVTTSPSNVTMLNRRADRQSESTVVSASPARSRHRHHR